MSTTLSDDQPASSVSLAAPTETPAPTEAPASTKAAESELEQARADQRQEANHLLGAGLGVGAFGVAGAIAFGSVCPVCVVAAPALLAAGAWKRYRARGGT